MWINNNKQNEWHYIYYQIKLKDHWNLVEKSSIWTTVLNHFMEKYNLCDLKKNSFISKNEESNLNEYIE